MNAIVTYVKDFVKSLLITLGLSNKKGSILLLGLDNAGKTTFLHKLKTNSIQQFAPTERANVESFSMQGIQFSGWDLGGHEAVRHLWEDYVCEASAILFLVDAADVARFEECRDELDALVGEQILGNVPIAILLNKCDLVEAHPSDVIADEIGYGEVLETHGDDRVSMFRISVYRGEGYQEAFRWVASFL